MFRIYRERESPGRNHQLARFDPAFLNLSFDLENRNRLQRIEARIAKHALMILEAVSSVGEKDKSKVRLRRQKTNTRWFDSNGVPKKANGNAGHHSFVEVSPYYLTVMTGNQARFDASN